MFLQQRKLDSKNLTKKVILFSIFTMSTIFSGAAFSADEEDPGEIIVIICGAECEQDYITPGDGGGYGGGGPGTSPFPSPIGGGPAAGGIPAPFFTSKAECELQATKNLNICNNIANSGAIIGGGYCAVIAPTGSFAAACLIIVGGATLVNLSQCSDMNAEDVFTCSSLP